MNPPAVAMVPHARIAEIWPHVEARIEAALDEGMGEYSLEDVLSLLASDQWQMWIATRPGRVVAVALTSIHQYPRKRILWLQLAGGDSPASVVGMWPQVRAFAKAQGCEAMTWQGRRGWWRGGVLPDDAKHVHDVVFLPVVGDEA